MGMMLLDEAIKWRKIKEFPAYSISENGDIRNDKTGKLKKVHHDKYGYLCCRLYDNYKNREMKVHRLVAEAFIENPENKPCVNHINGIKNDNRIENLEWCTTHENNYHAWNVLNSEERRKTMAEHARNRVWSEDSKEKISKINKGRIHTKEAKEHMSEAHKSLRLNRRKQIRCIELNKIYNGLEEASKDIGCCRTSISNALNGISKTGGGFHWETV